MKVNVKNAVRNLSGVMAQLQSTLMEICRSVGNYVPTIVSIKQAQDLKNWNRSGMPFDLIPEAQKQKKDYTKLANQLKVNEFIALTPDNVIKSNVQLQGRARYVQRLLRKNGKISSYRKITENEYRVYRIK